LFDLDGTLVDSVPDLAAAVNRLLQSRGLAPLPAKAVASMVGDGVAVLLARAFAARGTVPDDAAGADYARLYSSHVADATRPYPGVVAALERLAGEGWRMAVCTNKPRAMSDRLLEALKLAGFFAAVGGGDSFPVRKPDPRHLLATLRAAGGEPGRAVMAGDHRNDVQAARAAGMASIFAAWGYGTPDMAAGASAVAPDFPALADLAGRLLPA
jgi:phosphoglycolate phosphatase